MGGGLGETRPTVRREGGLGSKRPALYCRAHHEGRTGKEVAREVDAAECGVGARAVPGQGAAQTAVAALPSGHGGDWRADRPHVHADRQSGAAVQGIRRPGLGAVANTI